MRRLWTVVLFSWGGLALPGQAQTVFTWSSGSIPTQTVGVLDTLNITTFADHAFNGQNVLNNGIVNWQAGYLRSGYNAVFTNSTSGTFNDSADSHLDNPFGGGYSFTFQNDGMYNKTGTGTTMVETYFNNTGTVSIQAGTFSLSGSGGSSGSAVFSAASGAYIIFTNSYTLGDGTTLTGAGSFQQTGGTLIIAGNLTASNLAFNGGAVGGSPILHGSGYLWNTGDWSTGSRTTTTIASDGVLTIATGSDHNFNYRDVINNGIVNWQGGYLRSGYNSAFTNSPGAIFNDSASSHVDNPYGGGYYFAFQNDGTYNKTATGTTNFDTPFYNTGTADIQSGTFSVNGGGSSNSTAVFNTSSGASVVFTNSYTLGDGTTLTGAGAYQQTGGTLVITSNLTASNLVFNGGAVGGSPILHGSGYLWNTGDWSTGSRTTTTIASDGVLTIATGSDHNFNYRDVINNGIVNWQNGYLRSGYNSAFTNSPGAIFNDSASSHVDNPYGGGYYFAFQNDGTYNKTATGTTHFDTPFYNTGTANIQAGTFSVNGGGSSNSTAVFNTSSGASVVFTNSYTLGDGTTLTGAGIYQQTGGTLIIASNLTASNLAFNGGVLAGSPILHGTGYLWNSGDWGSGTSTIGTIASDGVLTIATSNDHSFNYRNLVNNGIVNWQGGYLRSGYNATFTNSSTGTFNDTADSHLDNPFGGGYSFTFINDGLYVKSGTGTTYLDTYLNNNGTVNVQAGVLAVNGGGTNSAAGVFNTSISATTSFNSSYTLADGSELLGSGVYQFTNGTLSIAGHLFADNLTFVSGTLGGSQTLHGAEYDWQGSDWSSGGSTSTTIASDGVLYVTTANDHNFNYRNLTNHGVINWQGGALRSGYNATFTNAADGVINDTASSHIENPFGGGYTFTFVNNGTYLKSGGGTTNIDTYFTNTGTVIVDSGTLAVNGAFTNSGGSIFVYNSAIFAAASNFSVSGVLGGNGTVASPMVTAGGVVSPGNSPGTLTITGNLTLLGTAQTFFEIGGTGQGTSYDFMPVSGNATLAGTLNLTMYGGFESSILNSDTFTIVSASSLTGVFSNAANGSMLLTTDGYGYFQVNYTGSAVTLSNFTAVPEPSTLALTSLGAAVLAASLRRRRRRLTRSSA